MAYDEMLAGRVRAILASRADVSERKMFGGIAFMLHGNMACGVVREDLMVRVGRERHEHALAQPGARPMDFTHKPLKGMVFVDAAGTTAHEDLARWVGLAAAFVDSLPPK